MSDPVPVRPVVIGRRPSAAPAEPAGSIAAALKDELGEAILQPIFREAQAKGLKGEGLVAHVLSTLLAMPAWSQNLLAIVGAGMIDHVFGKYVGGDAAARSTFRALAHSTLRAAPLAAFRALADIKEDGAREATLRKQLAELAVAASAPAVPTEAQAVMVIRSRAMSGEAGNHVHRIVGSNVLCLDFRAAKDAWDNKHHPTLLKDEGKGGGKDRGGPRASVKLADAEPFPSEQLTIKMAQEIGYPECPTCKPYTRAAEAAAKEAPVADTPHDAAGHPAPATNEKRPAPATAYTQVALAFVAAFGRSVDVSEADDANEIFLARPDLVERMALEWFMDHTDNTPKYDEKGALDAEQERKLKPHRELTDAEKLGVIRLLFTSGAAKPDQNPVLKRLLDRLSGKKVGEDPKAAAVALAEKELAAAQKSGGPLDVSLAERKLAEAKKAAEPEKKFPWLKVGILLAILAFLLTILISIGTIIHGVATAVDAETPAAATSAAGRK